MVIGAFVQGRAQSSGPQKRQSQPPVQHASWTSNLEHTYDIDEKTFTDIGLSALTTNQLVHLLVWSDAQAKKAKDSVPTVSFACGRDGGSLQNAKPEEYEKVRLYVSASGDAAEIISGVRERFRTMSGIEAVYSSNEADLTIHLVALQSKAQGTGQKIGNAVSVVVTQPCTWKLGTYTNNYDMFQDQWVQVGYDGHEVVSSIAAVVDADDLERQRKMNAGYKKFVRSA